jgi:hypothetical protein
MPMNGLGGYESARSSSPAYETLYGKVLYGLPRCHAADSELGGQFGFRRKGVALLARQDRGAEPTLDLVVPSRPVALGHPVLTPHSPLA